MNTRWLANAHPTSTILYKRTIINIIQSEQQLSDFCPRDKPDQMPESIVHLQLWWERVDTVLPGKVAFGLVTATNSNQMDF